MNRAEFQRFGGLLDSVCAMLSKGTYVPNAENTAMWFRALAKYDIDTVQAAFDAHVNDTTRGRYVPNPADILAQIEAEIAADGRPGAEEAWSTCVPGRDEQLTVVWTDEMRQAWGIALPVLRMGDEVGARMAFRQAYERLVAEARVARTPVRWHESPGFDAKQRAKAIEEAIRLKRLTSSDSAIALPAPEDAEQRLLELQTGVGAPPEHRAKLLAIRDQILAAESVAASRAQTEAEELRRRKDVALAAVIEHAVDPTALDTPAAEVLRQMDERRQRERAERDEGSGDGAL